MKTLAKTLLLGMGLCVFTACSDSFLEQEPEQSLSTGAAVQDLVSLSAAVNGVYSNYQDANIYGWDLPLIPDLRADNVYISRQNAGRFLDFDEYALDDQNGRSASEWLDHYEVIVNTSNIINGVPNGSFLSSEEAERDQLLGEAHALRGLTYWNLVRMFAPAYATDGGASLGVAFNNEGTNGEIITPARETVADTYAQIISDLQTGINLMTTTTDGRINKAAAQAILAKVYLYQENWQGAADMASMVISNTDYSLYPDSTAWHGSWGPNFGSEDLFALVNLPIDNLGVNSISGIMDQDGYGDVLATEDLFNIYSDTDYRRSAMIRGNRQDGEDNVLFPEGKYPTGELGEDYIKIIRLSDVYLIRAEARAELNQEDDARADLDAVGSLRDPNYVAATATGDALIDAILLERRKELAFEGDRVYDLTRRQRSWTKFRTNEDINASWDNPQVINPIPRAEMDNNPNMQQNAGY